MDLPKTTAQAFWHGTIGPRAGHEWNGLSSGGGSDTREAEIDGK